MPTSRPMPDWQVRTAFFAREVGAVHVGFVGSTSVAVMPSGAVGDFATAADPLICVGLTVGSKAGRAVLVAASAGRHVGWCASSVVIA